MGFSRQKYWSGVPLPSLILANRKDQTEVSVLLTDCGCWLGSFVRYVNPRSGFLCSWLKNYQALLTRWVIFCFVLFFSSAASEPSGSLFLHWYSSWTYYRVVPNSPRSHHISPDQTLADSWISAFTANIKITWQEFSQLFPEYLEKLFSSFHCYCLYTCYIPKFSHLLDHSSLLTANSTSGLWVLHPFHTAPRTALLKHTSHLLPSLSCFKSLTACNFFSLQDRKLYLVPGPLTNSSHVLFSHHLPCTPTFQLPSTTWCSLKLPNVFILLCLCRFFSLCLKLPFLACSPFSNPAHTFMLFSSAQNLLST